ncbi:hypothetical protein K431DRAFT_299450 [Polychaeton citri CBS 116435]|uniref:Malate dehydrogenase n=1 Tax=Polychaeton citri CBS 116435 TaxID=1314669 RepID=A0A9P4US53_9PEZI|nr:hypothetical protein K431DRAFT_299450 [Polychaeton citri CBS 116435]
MVARELFTLLALSALSLAAPMQSERRWRGWSGSNDGRGWWQPGHDSSYIDFAKRFSFDTCKCDLSKASMPQSPVALPSPAAGLSLYQVSVGRGTQNYTCATSDSSSAPAAVGAVAVLYNVTCLAATMPDLLAKLPNIALNLPTPTSTDPSSPVNMDIAGHHYFIDTKTPFFNFDTDRHNWGTGPFSKVSQVDPPSDALAGQQGKGDGAVKWLQLDTIDSSGMLQQVYRVNTAGGNPPKTCQGMPSAFEVQYAAEYWTYAGVRS